MDVEESLVSRRPKRSTAGNRMQAALAEFQVEELEQDLEEDVDFAIEKDEEDAFESDFESTDEEANQEDVDMAIEKEVRLEEKTSQKGARALAKTTAAAHARQKATFNPQMTLPGKTLDAVKIKRRVSLGVAINVETGEVIQGKKRQSQRRHTMLNTSETINRYKDAEEKKSTLPKKAKVQIRTFSQDELIARALDMEEDNIEEHRNYLTLEEERRKLARVVRMTVRGPLLRWLSKHEEVAMSEELSGKPSIQRPVAGPSAPMQYTFVPSAQPSMTQPVLQPATHNSTDLSQLASAPNTSTQAADHEKVAVCKNYVVHELDQSENAPRPPWHSTMTAMFGDHANWEEMKVYTTKGRPLSRPTQMCPITGKTAHYRDPRTNVPFSDLDAYRTLSAVLAHKYIWSDVLGCYISQEGSAFEAPPPTPPTKRVRTRGA